MPAGLLVWMLAAAFALAGSEADTASRLGANLAAPARTGLVGPPATTAHTAVPTWTAPATWPPVTEPGATWPAVTGPPGTGAPMTWPPATGSPVTVAPTTTAPSTNGA